MGVVSGLRQDHLLAVEPRLFDVDRAVVRRVLVARDPFAGVEDGIEGLARMVGEAFARGQRFGIDPVVEQEIERGAKRHGGLGWRFRPIANGARRLSRFSAAVRSPPDRASPRPRRSAHRPAPLPSPQPQRWAIATDWARSARARSSRRVRAGGAGARKRACSLYVSRGPCALALAMRTVASRVRRRGPARSSSCRRPA